MIHARLSPTVLALLLLYAGHGHAQAPARTQARPAPAPTAAPAPTPAPEKPALPKPADAVRLYTDGKLEDALRLADQILAAIPNEYDSLMVAMRANQDLGRYAAALPYAEKLTRAFTGSVAGWEILAQLYQATGALDRRDSALVELIRAQGSALDSAVRMRPYIIRDRIDAFGRSVLGRENFDNGSNDFVKYLFVPMHDLADPRAVIMLTADDNLTQSWIDSGMLAPGKRLFHLDSLFRGADNRQQQAVYQIYTDLPDYDTIRAKVLEIMAGKAKPLSGPVGGLAVPEGG